LRNDDGQFANSHVTLLGSNCKQEFVQWGVSFALRITPFCPKRMTRRENHDVAN
jgi:hypothetical protein